MSAGEPARLAELLGALSITTDLADGYRPEQAVRTTVLAMALADAHGVSGPETADVYWAALLRFLGCTAFAHEEGFYGAGDDVGLRRVMGGLDAADRAGSARAIVRGVGAGRPVGARIIGVGSVFKPSVSLAHHAAQCDAGQHLGRRLGLGDGVVSALGQVFARWDGKGYPNGLEGEALSLVARIVAVAEQVALQADRHGAAAARAVARQRSGGWFDPAVVATLLAECGGAVDAAADRDASAWEAFLDAEPEPRAHLTPASVDRAAHAFARYADLKSAWTLTHSAGVGPLAAAAGQAAGLDPEACTRLGHAGLLHDIGRVAVPNGIWNKAGPLNAAEWEQVRMHSYHTDRVLARTAVLAEVAAVAAAAHERPDGTGYHKGVPAGLLTVEGRILAAADAFHALCEARPHRPARSPKEAAGILAVDAGAGRFDLVAVRAVLDASGTGAGDRAPRPTWPAGLSDREVEVLGLVAVGRTNKEIARALGIAPKTVAHHVAHLYAKVGCTSRAGAALFAVEHNLLSPAGPGP